MTFSARDRAREYRRLARKVRAASRHISKPEGQRTLLDVAESYELLAAECRQQKSDRRHRSAA
jgi:hypothetical protein